MRICFSKQVGVLLFWGLFFLCSEVFAQTAIPSITITSEIDTQRRDETTSATVIPLKNAQSSGSTLSEVLSEQPGVHLTRYGGLEEATSISIRGSSESEVIILLDGVPLMSAASGRIDTSPFLLNSLDSIEIYRGFSPLENGLQPAAGTVVLNSKKVKNGTHFGSGLGAGSFNTVDADLFFSVKKKNLGLLTTFSMLKTDGDFTFLDNNGTPANDKDDRTIDRQNNKSETFYPMIKLTYDFNDKTHLTWVNHFLVKNSGVPGFESNQSVHAHLSTTAFLSSVRLVRDSFLIDDLSFESQSSIRYGKSQYDDPKGEIGLGGAQDNDDDSHLFSQQFTGTYYWGDYQIVKVFTRYQFEDFLPQDFFHDPSEGSSSTRHFLSMGIGDEIELLHGKLLINPAASFENVFNKINNDDPSFLTPTTFSDSSSNHEFLGKLGVKGKPFSFLTLKSNVYRSVRYPTFDELFGDRGGVVGNQLLDPQKSVSWDVGGEIVARTTEKTARNTNDDIQTTVFGVTYFNRYTDDLIQFEQSSGFARAENVGRAEIHGVEVQGLASFFNHLNLSANYTFQDSRDRANYYGKILPSNPRHELDGKVEGVFKDLKIFVSANWMDDIFLDRLNTRFVNDRIIVNSGFSFKPLRSLTVSFAGKNLNNDQIVDALGFPLPGRSFFGKIDWQL